MKAAAVDRFGPPSALSLHLVPVPRPGPQEVLIAIDAAGIGGWDASIRDGSLRKPGRPRFPLRGRVVHPNGVEPVPKKRPTFRMRAFDAVASPRAFDKLNRHFRNGRTRVPIAASYPLGKAAQAHRRLDRGHLLGRMVLQVHR